MCYDPPQPRLYGLYLLCGLDLPYLLWSFVLEPEARFRWWAEGLLQTRAYPYLIRTNAFDQSFSFPMLSPLWCRRSRAEPLPGRVGITLGSFLDVAQSMYRRMDWEKILRSNGGKATRMPERGIPMIS